jgi:hypothetical protein
MRRKKKSAAIPKYCKDKHGRNAPAVFGWTIHLRKFNSWDAVQGTRRMKSVAILKYGEDKQRRNRPPLFLDTQYASENSTLGMQCKTLPGAILKYCEDKQRRNAPKC